MTLKEKKDLQVMKFIHYFITEKNYNPVVVHGVQNEIWLENMDSEYKIVRIVMNYIHNEEQLDFDNYKVSKMLKQIKLKTFSFSMKAISFYIDINEDIKLKENNFNNMVIANTESKLFKNEFINKHFPDIKSKFKFTEEGEKLFEKINADIMTKNIRENKKINELFTPKKPIVTNILIGMMILIFILMHIFGNGSTDTKTLYLFGGLVKDNNLFRLITSIFLHIGIIHLISNMWALNILGKQTENFYGHIKMFIIFLYSGIIGNLISVLFMNDNTISAGASGAIFGLMGAILYFAINQRTYMQEALRKEILPVIILNLFLGFMISGINMYAHIGGLVGGILISTAVGIKYKTSKFEKTNGIITSIILLVGLIIFAYFK